MRAPEQAFASASRIMAETGAAAVKLEGGQAMASTIAFLSQRGIPVMAHIGLTPQAVNALGGYGARGRTNAEHDQIISDARAVADSGAFAIVAEGVIEPLAKSITAEVSCPVIGIGASADCDGQVLVAEDMLGLFERTPRFVKRYGDMAAHISAAVENYAAEVRSRAFPTPDQTYQPKK
jgi:3-methyl-2-oxobutanoate hydroxymethyltransferase